MIFQESIENENIPIRAPLDEYEQRIIWEPLKEKDKGKQSEDELEENGKLPEVNTPLRFVNVSGVLSHCECQWCDDCHKPIAICSSYCHVSNSRGKFHKFCYVCKKKKHEQLAQDLQNFFSNMADEESSLLRDNSVFNEAVY